jgi:site-specific recombinase XerD
MELIEEFGGWLAHPERRRHLSAATIRDYQHQVRAFATWLAESLGYALTADAVTPYRLTHYLTYLQTVRIIAPATQAKAVVALSAFGQWLVACGERPASPAQDLSAQREQPRPPKALAPTVVRRLLDAAHHTGDLRDAVVVEILAKSGMRASEVAGIQIEHLERGVRTTWVRVEGKGNEVRRVPLPKLVGQLIEDYLDLRLQREGQRPTSGPLFMGQRGGMTRSTINRIVDEVAGRAQLTPAQQAEVTPHSFHHTVATILVRQRDLVTVADLLGHENVNTTRRYTKASASELEDTVELLRYQDGHDISA